MRPFCFFFGPSAALRGTLWAPFGSFHPVRLVPVGPSIVLAAGRRHPHPHLSLKGALRVLSCCASPCSPARVPSRSTPGHISPFQSCSRVVAIDRVLSAPWRMSVHTRLRGDLIPVRPYRQANGQTDRPMLAFLSGAARKGSGFKVSSCTASAQRRQKDRSRTEPAAGSRGSGSGISEPVPPPVFRDSPSSPNYATTSAPI